MYQGPALIQVSNRGKDLFTLPYFNLEAGGKERKKSLKCSETYVTAGLTGNRKAVCLTQTYFFPSFFLTAYYQNPPG